MRRPLLVALLAFTLAGIGTFARAQPFCPGVTPWVFDDVQAGDPFCGYITWMATSGVTLGCSTIDANHRLYCPDDFVTRKQMAAFMKRQADAVMPLTCAAGQVMKWNGAVWACADDNIGGSGGGGTVTSVLAGTGLQASPNPIVGAGSINLAPSFQLPQNCAPGQVAKSNGSNVWTCQNDNDANSGGTVTSVAAGTGLAASPANPISGAGTLTLAVGYQLPQGCASGQVPKSNGAGGWTCQADDAGPTNAFVQGGNAFGAAAVLGTTEDQPLDVRVNSSRVMRYEPNTVSPNVIGGSPANNVTAGVRGATIAGGGVPAGATDPDFSSEAPNRVTDAYGTIGGGYANRAGDDAGTTIDSAFATVGGGIGNAASGWMSTVSGGGMNTASGQSGTVGGGGNNIASGTWSTAGGGDGNIASGTSSTAGGGGSNTASGEFATVAGGYNNDATNTYSTIGGGFENAALAELSTIVGGASNFAAGMASTVAGGRLNEAYGNYSFAAGRRAKALADGVFVLADSSNFDFVANTPNSFAVRATGGVRFVTAIDGTGNPTRTVSIDATGQVTIPIDTAAPNLTLSQAMSADYARLRFVRNGGAAAFWDIAAGAAADVLNFYRQGSGNVMSLTPGGPNLLLMSNGAGLTAAGVWTSVSDRNVKENFAPIDVLDVLARVVALPVTQWNYKAEPGVKRIGPVAQDFHGVFGLGGDDKTIGTVDADGVALAAIQGLNRKLETKIADQVRDLEMERAARAELARQVEAERTARQAQLAQRDADIQILREGLARQRAEIARLQASVVEVQASRDDVATLKAAMAELLRERAGATPAAVPASLRH